MFNNNFSDRVRKEVAIESYISRYVKLKKTGNKFKGLCPFHTEKTPSFTVSPDVQLYYCFGCHKAGDIFRFVMDYEKVDFNRAKEILADYSGIPLHENRHGSLVAQNLLDELYNINKKSADFFHKILQSEQGNNALEYLRRRGISDSDIKLFQLGYALDEYETLVGKMSSSELEFALKVGLVKERPKMKGSYYDFFRGRIIFPIKDVNGKVAGFGGRILNDSGEAKYINSPASAIYDKGKMFYNLNGAIAAIRKTRVAVIVEGYLDVIGLVAKNIENVIAPLGTALTENQVRIIKNYADKIMIMMDGDAAGRKAALNSCEIALNEGLEAEVILLDPSDDPFDLSRRLSTIELQTFLLKSIPASAFIINEIMGKVDYSSTPEQKKKAVLSLFEFVGGMKKEVDKQAYLGAGAKKLGVSEASVLHDFIKEKGSKKGILDSDKVRKEVVVNKKPSVAVQCERKLIAMLIKKTELFEFSAEIQDMEFQDEDSAFIWDIIYTRYRNQESISPSDIINLNESNQESVIAPYLMESEEEDGEILEKIFRELILRQKVAVIDSKLGLLVKIGTLDEVDHISKMAYYKTEKEKILGYIRNLH